MLSSLTASVSHLHFGRKKRELAGFFFRRVFRGGVRAVFSGHRTGQGMAVRGAARRSPYRCLPADVRWQMEAGAQSLTEHIGGMGKR